MSSPNRSTIKNSSPSLQRPATLAAIPLLAEGTAKIWTLDYMPFRMGGNVEQPIFTIVPVIERRKIKGFDFFAFKTPKGTTIICEGQTGGIIAGSFNELVDNIKGVPKKVLQEQIDGAKHLAARSFERTNEEFFQKYRL